MRYSRLGFFGESIPVQDTVEYIVSQEQFGSTCNPAHDNKDKMCGMAMTTWWVAREGRGGPVVFADKDEGRVRTWASKQEAAANKPEAMPEPTDMETPAPGTDIEQGPRETTPGNTIMGFRPRTLLLAGGAAAALFFMTRG